MWIDKVVMSSSYENEHDMTALKELVKAWGWGPHLQNKAIFAGSCEFQ